MLFDPHWILNGGVCEARGGYCHKDNTGCPFWEPSDPEQKKERWQVDFTSEELLNLYEVLNTCVGDLEPGIGGVAGDAIRFLASKVPCPDCENGKERFWDGKGHELRDCPTCKGTGLMFPWAVEKE
jgi:hypothetical protein